MWEVVKTVKGYDITRMVGSVIFGEIFQAKMK